MIREGVWQSMPNCTATRGTACWTARLAPEVLVRRGGGTWADGACPDRPRRALRRARVCRGRAAARRAPHPRRGTDPLGELPDRLTHLTLLVADGRGWRNLCYLIARARHHAAVKGAAYLPADELDGHTDGLLALSGCRQGALATALLADDAATAQAVAAALPRSCSATQGSPLNCSTICCPLMSD